MSYIVNRPKNESGFGLVRQEGEGRNIRYTVHRYYHGQVGGRALLIR